MDSTDTVISKAGTEDAQTIVDLSSEVQNALTASGSLQQIGPLDLQDVKKAIAAGHCYAIKNNARLVGCAFVIPMTPSVIAEEYEDQSLDISHHVEPWLYMHSIMLRPDLQGRGLGRILIDGAVESIEAKHTRGTIFLDCWAGNDKLKAFYKRVGFDFVQIVPQKDYEVALFCRKLESRHPEAG
ncbi:hypothetical protein CB0940_03613 [Cercospora beticola]|uniref:N-acetyltransferase domain-containing protein n=1 Tax=Cercospora beticola TaxID=122368 RepID=A0A2G5I3A2_CERBT|nr:hypothetical protein CB0940_03613 [Cercospora beticola]PIA98982.1 hypothetical protein CB0940_03613 [Cercospora beticola]WPB00793.1 hypothetical protein RHO25_005413 [Cercospora beticola]CAK1360970.1 unnamed protein product [Cercospora beticola]